tara:strand:- start:549 stop:767 length:219 start_codon:yes stop_codon:yes gene_type:complete
MILMRKRGDDDIFLDCVGGAHKILKKKTEKKELLTSVRFVIKIFTFLYLKEIALYIVENRSIHARDINKRSK